MTENKNPFKDAIQTDALVVKPGVKPITDFNAKQKLVESLEFLTKNDLVEIAEEVEEVEVLELEQRKQWK